MTEVTDASTTGAVSSPLDETLVAHNKALIDRNVALVAERDAAIQREEAAQTAYRDMLRQAEADLTEARAQAGLAWEAGRKVGAGKGGCGYPCGYDCNGACFSAPADLSAALTARLDAEWAKGFERGASWDFSEPWPLDDPDRIRALRRAAPTEGEAQSLDDTTRAVLDRAERIVAGQSQQEQRTAEIFLRPTEGEA